MKYTTVVCFLLAFFSLGVLCQRSFGQTVFDDQIPEKRFQTGGSWGDDGGVLGAEVTLFGYVQAPVENHVYELRYLLRLQKKIGDKGHVLTNKANPNGVAFTLKDSTNIPREKSGALKIYGSMDLTRSIIRSMGGIPRTGKWAFEILRVEPLIYDKTAEKYITKSKTEAMIFIVEVKSAGMIGRLFSLRSWLKANCHLSSESFQHINTVLSSLDHFDIHNNELPTTLEDILDGQQMEDAELLVLLNSIRPEWVPGKNNLNSSVGGLMNHANKEVAKRAKELYVENEYGQ